MKITVIYFHGFNGKNSTKFNLMKEHFKGCKLIEFNQTYNLKNDSINFQKLIDEEIGQKKYIIGSSLGCIYSMYFALMYKIECLLINPSFFPETTLKEKLRNEELENLLSIKKEIEKFDFNYNLFRLFNIYLAKDDEILNFDSFLSKFKNFRRIVWFEKKGHRFRNFEENLANIYKLIWTHDYKYELEPENEAPATEILFEIYDETYKELEQKFTQLVE